MLMTEKHKPVVKANKLLEAHQDEIIRELGLRAYDLLTPAEVRKELDIEASRIPDLIRQKWLVPVSGKTIGSAYLYYRWRVEFVKRYRKRYAKRTNTPKNNTIEP